MRLVTFFSVVSNFGTWTTFAGSKILLTSRNESVGLDPDLKCVIFRPRLLTHEDSWEVFQKLALTERNDIGMSLIILVTMNLKCHFILWK